ncbi:MAG: zf-HC2 domain-containing protein [Sulfitobacter sp.]
MITVLGQKMRMLMEKLPGMIDCEQFETFIQAYIDDELTPAQRRVFDLHMKVCPDCRRYIAAYRQTLDALKDVSVENHETLPEVPEDLIQAILDANAS